MNPWSFAALGVSLALAGAMLPAIRFVHPRIGALSILLAIVGIAMSTVWIISAPAITFLLHISSGDTLVEWCRSWLSHSDVSPAIGVTAILLLLTQTALVARRFRTLRASAEALSGGSELTVLNDETPIALTTPGPAGRIIVSTSMLRLLSPGEQRAMLAHERAHLECRHDRYLAVAELAVVALPPLAPLQRLLRRSLERWADERAAAETGDRSALARAIGIAAVATSPTPAFTSAIAGNDIEVRLGALESQARFGHGPGAFTMSSAILVSSALAAIAGTAGVGFQFHYLGELIVRICPF